VSRSRGFKKEIWFEIYVIREQKRISGRYLVGLKNMCVSEMWTILLVRDQLFFYTDDFMRPLFIRYHFLKVFIRLFFIQFSIMKKFSFKGTVSRDGGWDEAMKFATTWIPIGKRTWKISPQTAKAPWRIRIWLKRSGSNLIRIRNPSIKLISSYLHFCYVLM
jgi:hypothetical protein